MRKGGLHTGTGQSVGDWSLFRMSKRLSGWLDDCVVSASRFVKSPLSLTKRGTDRRTAEWHPPQVARLIESRVSGATGAR
jgi:hypothetical protein